MKKIKYLTIKTFVNFLIFFTKLMTIIISLFGVSIVSYAVIPKKEIYTPPILEIHQANNVDYITGGVGLDESTILRHEVYHWPLSLEFIGCNGTFLSNVNVNITNNINTQKFEVISQGPYMLVRLQPGFYTVNVNYNGHSQIKHIHLFKKHNTHIRFYWKLV